MAARSLVVLALGVLVLAGCTAPAAVQPSTAPGATSASPMSDFKLTAHGCSVGGGHSIHSTSVERFVIPEPWKAADILDDIGPQLVFPEEPEDGVPTKGNTWGNWHVTVACKDWSGDDGALKDFSFGFVATRVETPPWDDSAPGRSYILNVLGTSDQDILEHFHMAGFHATPATGVSEWLAPDVFHHKLDTKDHGVYESIYKTVDAGDAAPDGIVRLWWQHENEDKTFSPVALDLKLSAGGKHLYADPNGYFSHLRTDDHAPIPGAAGNIAGLNWEGVDLEVTLGPAPPVVLEKAYAHL